MANSGFFIGGYAVERLIKQGGMGKVYFARDSRGMPVAVKVLDLAAIGIQPSAFYKAFRDEYEIQRQLANSTRHVVRPYAFNYDERLGTYYLAMEYAPGSLQEMLARGPQPLQQTARILQDVGRGLYVANSRGVIHRDVKPSNILFRASGEAILGDFGISKVVNRPGLATRLGRPMGTPQYMSPEQILNRPLDGRSDAYSLAAVAFEMMGGAPPFNGDWSVVVNAHLSQPPPRLPQVPAEVEKVIRQGLEKDMTRRPSVAAFVNDFSRAAQKSGHITSKPNLTPSDPAPSAFPVWLILILIVVVLGILMMLVAASGGGLSLPNGSPQVIAASTGGFATCAAGARPPSSGGVVYAAGDGADSGLYLLSADGQTCLLTVGQGASGPSANADGSALLYTAQQGGITRILRLTLNDGKSVAVAAQSEAFSPNWLPGSDLFVFDARVNNISQVFMASANGGSATRLTNTQARASEPAWRRDGGRIAYAADVAGKINIFTMNASGADTRRVTDEAQFGGHPAWSPDGGRIVYECGLGDAREICVIQADGSGRAALTNNGMADTHPAWSPDGRWIVFVRQRAGHGAYDLVFYDVFARAETMYVVGKPVVNTPSWLPNQ